MNNNGKIPQNGYFTDKYGNVYSSDGRLIKKSDRLPQTEQKVRNGKASPTKNNDMRYNYYDERQNIDNRQSNYHTGYNNSYQNTYGTTYQAPRRRRRDPRAGREDRSRVRIKKPGIRKYNSTIESDRSGLKTVIVAVILIIVAVIAALIIKYVSTEYVGELPDFETESNVNVSDTEDNTSTSETYSSPVSSSVTYAERNSSTAYLGTQIDCTNAILIDLENNFIAAEKGGDEKIYPASMTKVMTALIAVEKCPDLEATFTVTNEIVAPLAAANASVAGFTPGEIVTVRDLLYGTILPSGADATSSLAVFIAGNESAFAALMNEKCESLGLQNTHFTNASGLHDDNHYSTCHDIALIMKEALKNETLREIMGTYEYTTTKTEQHPDGITLYDTMYSRIDGKEEFDDKIEIIAGKTGYTGEAGNCLVSAAKVIGEDKTWIFVCSGGESKWKPIYDTIHVYRTYLGILYDGEYIPKYMR